MANTHTPLKLPKRLHAVLHPELRSDLRPDFTLPVGSGWSVLVVDLLDALVALDAQAPGSVQVVQIKEKFGRLRVYLARSNRAASELIDAANRASASICEGCGCDSMIRNRGGWLTTMCDSCFGPIPRT